MTGRDGGAGRSEGGRGGILHCHFSLQVSVSSTRQRDAVGGRGEIERRCLQGRRRGEKNWCGLISLFLIV